MKYYFLRFIGALFLSISYNTFSMRYQEVQNKNVIETCKEDLFCSDKRLSLSICKAEQYLDSLSLIVGNLHKRDQKKEINKPGTFYDQLAQLVDLLKEKDMNNIKNHFKTLPDKVIQDIFFDSESSNIAYKKLTRSLDRVKGKRNRFSSLYRFMSQRYLILFVSMFFNYLKKKIL